MGIFESMARGIKKATGMESSSTQSTPPRTQGERSALVPDAPKEQYGMGMPPDDDEAIREAAEVTHRAQKAAQAEDEARLKGIREHL